MLRALIGLLALGILVGCRPKPLPVFGSSAELAKLEVWAVGYWTIDETSLPENLRSASRRSAAGRVGEQYLDFEADGRFRYSTTSRNGHSVHVDGRWAVEKGALSLKPESVDGEPVEGLREGTITGGRREMLKIVDNAERLGPFRPHPDGVRLERTEPGEETSPRVWRRVRFF